MGILSHELRLRIGGDSTDFNRAAKDVQKTSKTLGRTLTAIGTGIGAGMFTAFARDAVKAASDAEEIASKYSTVFRGIGDEANTMANRFATAFDLAGSTAQKMLSDTGDLLAGFGYTAAEAANMSERVNTLAVDLASFTNYVGGAAGASSALTKALLGESEAAKALGIVIRQSDPGFIARVNVTMKQKGISLLQARQR